MKRNTMSLAAIGLIALGGAASAHATLEQKEARAGAATKITLRVPHGCDGQATHTVRIRLPEGFYAAQPMPKAGWQLEVVTGAYATPYMNHGTEMTEGAREVVWSGGHLEDAWYDEFTLRGTVGPDVAPGSRLYFPAEQLCADGVADWTDTSGTKGVTNPAPSVTVVAGDAGGHGHDHGAAANAAATAPVTAAPVTAGPLQLTGAFGRATLPNAPVGGGYVTITNTGPEDDRLIGAASPAAGRMEVHEMSMTDGVMRMRQLTDGLAVPAGQTVALKPGGLHLMFMDLPAPLREGTQVPVTLTFEKAGAVELPFVIGAPNAKEMAHDHGQMAPGGDAGHGQGHDHGTK